MFQITIKDLNELYISYYEKLFYMMSFFLEN